MTSGYFKSLRVITSPFRVKSDNFGLTLVPFGLPHECPKYLESSNVGYIFFYTSNSFKSLRLYTSSFRFILDDNELMPVHFW